MSESPWEKEHYDQWERENKRARQEKHEEKFWSEIIDGTVSASANSTVDATNTTKFDPTPDPEIEKLESLSFDEKLQKLRDHFKKGKK